MLELAVAIGLVVLFSGSTIVGIGMRRMVPEAHRSKETIELMALVMSLVVTFAALVLSILTTSAKGVYDTAERDRVHFAGQLTQLDQCMRNYGPGSDSVRVQLASYTAAIVASTWPSEPHPTGVSYPDPSRMAVTGPNPVLAALLNRVGVEIRNLDQGDPLRRKLADDCYDLYKNVLESRWAVVEDIYSGMSFPFFGAVVFWMILVFAGFGLRTPTNPTAIIVLVLGAAAVTSALVLVLDLSLPYEGLFSIPSTSMRVALDHMTAR